ncbi:hypothetical protein [Caballeronia sordidicola]|jgi:hypothetical protein|nr:hypothetical protein [Caballeronia sordidicola]
MAGFREETGHFFAFFFFFGCGIDDSDVRTKSAQPGLQMRFEF